MTCCPFGTKPPPLPRQTFLKYINKKFNFDMNNFFILYEMHVGREYLQDEFCSSLCVLTIYSIMISYESIDTRMMMTKEKHKHVDRYIPCMYFSQSTINYSTFQLFGKNCLTDINRDTTRQYIDPQLRNPYARSSNCILYRRTCELTWSLVVTLHIKQTTAQSLRCRRCRWDEVGVQGALAWRFWHRNYKLFL